MSMVTHMFLGAAAVLVLISLYTANLTNTNDNCSINGQIQSYAFCNTM